MKTIPSSKVCNACGIDKPLSEYHKCKGRKYGVKADCKECRNAWKRAGEKIHNWSNKRYAINKLDPEFMEKKKAYNREYKRRPEVKKRYVERCKNDPNFGFMENYRKLTQRTIKRAGGSREEELEELLGCTIDEARAYIESMWEEGMTWDNNTLHGWHIDHIRPRSSFDLRKKSDRKKCFHYTNLQPLWARDNLVKGSKYRG